MQNKIISKTILGLASGLIFAASATAQTAAAADDDTEIRYVPTEEVKKLVRTRLANALPVWDKRLLTSYETGTPWEDNLRHETLGKLLGEAPFSWEGTATPPPDADRLVDEGKSMRIRRAEGAFRYQSRKRVFTPDLKGKAAPAPDAVSRQLEGILRNLAFPLVEADRPDVQTQEVALSGPDGKVAERFPTYAFYLLERQIEGVPVEGSTVRAAINLRGEVQRLKIAWPHFKVRSGAQLRSRERVLEEAYQKVVSQHPTSKLAAASRLVYAKTAKGEYLPAVQVDVSDGQTPYRLTIPVAE